MATLLTNEKVVSLPATTTFTAEMALKSALDLELTDVLVIGYDKDGDLLIRSSRLLRSDALWLVEKARAWVVNDAC
jgi:hypothetical protein